MNSSSLPEQPDLGQLKKQAKEFLAAVHAGVADAVARAQAAGASPESFALHDAQRILARERGFASWAKLKVQVETHEREDAIPRLIEAALEGQPEIVRAICQRHPALAADNAAVAATLGEHQRIEEELRRNAGFAGRKIGPRAWEPLLYVCFGRIGGGDEDRAAAARALLAHGANPNAHWIHPSWADAPLTPLYGATGVNNFPGLARVLLEAGANPNDGESRYHAAEHGHIASLEVLAAFGTDFSRADPQWGNTVLYFLLGCEPSPAVRTGLRWLLEHGADPNVVSHAAGSAETALHTAVHAGWDAATVELLLRHGADPAARRGDGRTAYALAVAGDRQALVEALEAHGAATPVAAVDRFFGACMRGDMAGARGIAEREPTLLRNLSPLERQFAHLAAREGRAGAIGVLHACGFDVDIPGAMGERPLHWACWHGWAETVQALIAAGVALGVSDGRFRAPPSGWCAHGSLHRRNPAGDYPRVMELLIRAGASISPQTIGSDEVMAVLKRHGIPIAEKR